MKQVEYECQTCGERIIIKGNKTPAGCSCGNKNKFFIINFKSEELINNILKIDRRNEKWE